MHRAHLDFALALHQQLPARGDQCWSPYSAAAALALAAAGARGGTREELAAALAPGRSLPELAAMLAESASPPDAEAAVTNALWLERQLRFQEDYLRAARELPGGAVHPADFRNAPEQARQAINDDVERATRGLIRDLIAPGLLSRETAAVIVNALYLKVGWLSAFAASATAPAAFQAPAGTRQVRMMHQQESFPYAEGDGWRMVSLPTASTMTVDVLLPPEGEVEPAPPAAELVLGLRSRARARKLALALPRFRVEQSVLLNDPLRRLGVRAAFTRDRADFSGITDQERIFIDLVLHKSVLRVDEQGFEGAAATAVVMRMVSMDMSRPTPFVVDRPFLVLVRHRETGAIYFLARVTEP